MTTTILPSDLRYGRELFMAVTGLAGSAVGALPDPAHKTGGGYHCGCQDIINIGRWYVAGSPKADYSVRQARDRVGGNTCSAHDVSFRWPNGGDAAWIRWNNLFLAQLQAADPALLAVRAINFTPDGASRKRYDTNNRAQGVINSTDSVDSHTHIEYWRNTEGTVARGTAMDRIAQLMQTAIWGGNTMADWNTTFVPPEETQPISLNVALQIVYNSLLHGDMDGGYTANVFEHSIFGVLKRMEAKIDAQGTGALPPITQEQINAAVAAALSDPAIVAGLVKAINDDAAQRLAH